MRSGLPDGRLAAVLFFGLTSLAFAAQTDSQSFQRVRALPDAYSVQYGFLNFNQDSLDVSYQVGKPAFDRYLSQYGYRMKEVHAAPDVAAYMRQRGFKIVGDHRVAVDMPLIVKRNAPLLKPVALAIDKVAQERGYGSGDLLGAVLSLVQTAMLYKVPPAVVGDLHTGGILPPVASFIRGWGDCDTKSGVAASILANWPHMRMVGIAAPDHYLLAVLRIPNKGDMYVDYEGLQYVLVEPAGPAWLPPGTVSEHTADLLAAGGDYQIEPFF